MNSLRRYLLAAALALMATSGFSDDSLESLRQQLGEHDITVGQFNQQRYIRGLLQPLQSSGRFLYDQSLGIVWQVEKPFPSRLLLTEEGGWIGGEPQPQLSLVYELFSSLLASRLDRLTHYFELESHRQGPRWQLVLRPKEAAMAQYIERVALRAGQQIEAVTLYETGGDRTELTFEEVTHPVALSADQRRLYQHDQ